MSEQQAQYLIYDISGGPSHRHLHSHEHNYAGLGINIPPGPATGLYHRGGLLVKGLNVDISTCLLVDALACLPVEGVGVPSESPRP